jgi:hypothetical protein
MEASSSMEARDGEVRQVIEKRLLQALDATGRVSNSLDFAQQQQVDHAVVVSVLKKLESHEVINAVVVEVSSTELTKEGQEVVLEGSPEARLFAAIDPEAGTPKADTEVRPLGPPPGCLSCCVVRLFFILFYSCDLFIYQIIMSFSPTQPTS